SSLAPGNLNTGYKLLDTHLKVESQYWSTNLRAWISKDNGNGAGGAQALDTFSTDNYDLYTFDTAYSTNDWFKNWNNTIKFDYSYFKLDANFTLLPPGSVVGIGDDGNIDFTGTNVTFTDGLIGNPGGESQDTQLTLTNTYKGINNHNLRISIGSRYQSLDTTETKNFGPGVLETLPSSLTVDGTLTDVSDTDNVYLSDTSRRIGFISLQDEWQVKNDLQLTLGVRYDNYSDFGETTNPRIALVWKAHPILTTKLLYGSAFRAPSFSELGFRNNPTFIGNDNLTPEKIDTYEASFTFLPYDDLQTTLSLYSYNAEDLIVYVPTTNGNIADNAAGQDGYGVEWELSWQLSDNWRISGNYSRQESENSDTGETIADAPGQQFTFNSFWQLNSKWLISSQINWVADRERSNTDNRSAIDDYTITDLTLRKNNIYKGLDIALGIRNLFDENAREPSDGLFIQNDFPLEGRNLWLELRYQF
ncbi:MAG: TonB-dependent receptor, partial [Bacteroidota bacterium]